MVRSAQADVFDKFRFRVDFFDFEPKNLYALNFKEDATIRAGFSEVTLPEIRVGVRTYRENIDPIRHIKAAGLVTYEPIILRRGKSLGNRELYNWYKLINDDAAGIGAANSALSSIGKVSPQNAEYRKEVTIGVYNRQGEIVRAFVLFNAFPISYKGGDGLKASADEKLIEEITITYEAVIELNSDDLSEINSEINKAAKQQALAGIISAALG